MPEYIKICEEAARAGGAVLLDWAGRFSAREKGPSDLVTEADLASQEIIRQRLLTAFPDHAFLGEEDEIRQIDDGRPRWIVDPLDGTMNYVHGVPDYSVSVALVHQGQTLAGTVFNPVTRECFTAASGQGAFLNGARLRTSGVTSTAQALVAMSFAPRVRRDSPDVARFIEAIEACQGLRRMGSAALNLAYVAAGRYDAYWTTNTKAWDVAAGILLIRE
ncbi:MAG: inositol monophosphatase, partial [Planctomycetes bacterium]|nr:inositol monophosphatase [Planctomycetota bacterium]